MEFTEGGHHIHPLLGGQFQEGAGVAFPRVQAHGAVRVIAVLEKARGRPFARLGVTLGERSESHVSGDIEKNEPRQEPEQQAGRSALPGAALHAHEDHQRPRERAENHVAREDLPPGHLRPANRHQGERPHGENRDKEKTGSRRAAPVAARTASPASNVAPR